MLDIINEMEPQYVGVIKIDFPSLYLILSIVNLNNVSDLNFTFKKYIASDRVTRWGNWYSAQFCPNGSYVKGFGLKVEKPQGLGDDTALNAIKLICDDNENTVLWSDRQENDNKYITYGKWESKDNFCPRGKVNGFQIKAEKPGGDDTAANSINMQCEENFLMLSSYKGEWGTWSDVKTCQNKTFVCGMSVQVEPNSASDKTALNNVNFFCCV